MINNKKRIKGLLIFALFLIFSPCFSNAANKFDVVINEIAWMGNEISYKNEWIEIYNTTDSSINLEGWKLIAVDKIPEIELKGKIPVKSFFLLERDNDEAVEEVLADQIYKGALENKGEILELYDKFGNLIDKINCDSGWFAGDNLTKQTMERINYLVSGEVSKNWQDSKKPFGTPKAENSNLSLKKENNYQADTIKETENLNQEFFSNKEKFSASLEKQSNSFSLLITALIIAIFSAIVILFLKRKIKNL